jgi:hypothetical protein
MSDVVDGMRLAEVFVTLFVIKNRIYEAMRRARCSASWRAASAASSFAATWASISSRCVAAKSMAVRMCRGWRSNCSANAETRFSSLPRV